MERSSLVTACSVAGLDPSGGAGLSADIKTFHSLNVWGFSVISAITAQNPGVVRGIWNMTANQVTQQITTLLEEFRITAVKTGLLGTREVIEAVSISFPSSVDLIIDPVIISTSRYRLIDDDAINALKEFLIPRALIVTPNLPEAEVLSGVNISDEESMKNAAHVILQSGVKYVIIKGGHAKEEKYSTDYLFWNGGSLMISENREPYEVHGSGCTFSAAITAGIAKGYSVEDSVKIAKKFVTSAIKKAQMSPSGIYLICPPFPELH